MDETKKKNWVKECSALCLLLWFAYVCLGKPFDITIPYFGNWYNMTGGEKMTVGMTSLFGGVYGWVISQFQLNGEMHPIKIFGGFYALAFGIIISIYIFMSFLESLFS